MDSKAVRRHALRGDALTIKVPPGTTILSTDIHGGVIDLWVLSPFKEETLIERKFALVGTNDEMVIDEGFTITHVGTFMLDDKDKTVLHLFEIIDNQNTTT